jgi:hypothetical protein
VSRVFDCHGRVYGNVLSTILRKPSSDLFYCGIQGMLVVQKQRGEKLPLMLVAIRAQAKFPINSVPHPMVLVGQLSDTAIAPAPIFQG